MKAAPVIARRAEPAVHFRGEIDKAVAAGLAREDMMLLLTHTDVSKLKRDGTLAVADISFDGGEMRFLGVKVKTGGVPQSILQHGKSE